MNHLLFPKKNQLQAFYRKQLLHWSVISSASLLENNFLLQVHRNWKRFKINKWDYQTSQYWLRAVHKDVRTNLEKCILSAFRIIVRIASNPSCSFRLTIIFEVLIFCNKNFGSLHLKKLTLVCKRRASYSEAESYVSHHQTKQASMHASRFGTQSKQSSKQPI